MPIIKITDTDFTTPGSEAFDYDIAYVPGFTYKTGAPTEPTLCRTVYEFEDIFGTHPVQFITDQYINRPETFPDNPSGDTSALENFGMKSRTVEAEDGTQINQVLVMPKYSYDIAYMYAKELISSGLAVYYHAVSVVDETLEVVPVTQEPADWSTNYSSYLFKNDNDEYEGYEPKLYYTALTAFTTFESDKYYEKIETTGEDAYDLLQDRPSDWKKTEWPADKFYSAVEGAPEYNPSNCYQLVEEGEAADLDVFYNNFKQALQDITAVNEYNIKYITSGGYPTFEINNGPMQAMIDCASQMAAGTMNAGRGDCIALVDTLPCSDRPQSNAGSVIELLNSDGGVNVSYGQYGTIITDWAFYNRNTTDYKIVEDNVNSTLYDTTVPMSRKESINYTDYLVSDPKLPERTQSFLYEAGFPFPGSFAYLKCVANQLASGNSWLAVAGVQRGIIPNYVKSYNANIITNKLADFKLQSRDRGISINPITYINGYGTCIWGNRTLFAAPGNLVASNFLNIRSMLCDLKKVCYRAAKRNTFEQDSEILWINFTQPIKALLEQMKTSYCISNYKIIRNNNISENATLGCIIKIYPLYAIEDFDIDIELYDSEVTVSE